MFCVSCDTVISLEIPECSWLSKFSCYGVNVLSSEIISFRTWRIVEWNGNTLKMKCSLSQWKWYFLFSDLFLMMLIIKVIHNTGLYEIVLGFSMSRPYLTCNRFLQNQISAIWNTFETQCVTIILGWYWLSWF